MKRALLVGLTIAAVACSSGGGERSEACERLTDMNRGMQRALDDGDVGAALTRFNLASPGFAEHMATEGLDGDDLRSRCADAVDELNGLLEQTGVTLP